METTRYLWAPPLIFLIGFLLLRISGKRAVASMSNFDLFVVAVIGTALGGTINIPDSVGKTVIGTGLLVFTYLLFSKLMLNNAARRLMIAKPTVLIHKGKINETGLRHVRMTLPELLGHLRIKGYPAITDVEVAIMEEAGDISVIPMSKERPIPVILDGEWIEENLQVVQCDKKYVIMQLQRQGFTGRAEDMTLVTVDNQRQVVGDPAQRDQQPLELYDSAQQAETAVLSERARQVLKKKT